jgi:hypothetical protein
VWDFMKDGARRVRRRLGAGDPGDPPPVRGTSSLQDAALPESADSALPGTIPRPLAASVLALPVTALPNVDDAASDALAGIGIRTVSDLAQSLVFMAAAQLTSPTGFKLDMAPADWVDEKPPAGPPDKWPVQRLRGVTDRQGDALQKALKVSNLGELTAWPPYPLARSLLSFAIGLGAADDDATKTNFGYDETVPADLIPGNNLPSESVRYTTLVLGEVREPAPAAPGRGSGR